MPKAFARIEAELTLREQDLEQFEILVDNLNITFETKNLERVSG